MTEIQPNVEKLLARCSRPQAEILVQYDHHRVRVSGRWGIMITYHWMPLEDAVEPLVVEVIFNPSRKHLKTDEQVRAQIFNHPLAPDTVQVVIDQLHFFEALPH